MIKEFFGISKHQNVRAAIFFMPSNGGEKYLSEKLLVR